MEFEKQIKLDEKLEKDIKDCKRKAEFIEKVLTMLVKGFAPEY
jgi:hypothetical protein